VFKALIDSLDGDADSPPEVIWAFRESKADAAVRYGRVFEAFDGAAAIASINYYAGIDLHTELPLLVDALSAPPSGATPGPTAAIGGGKPAAAGGPQQGPAQAVGALGGEGSLATVTQTDPGSLVSDEIVVRVDRKTLRWWPALVAVAVGAAFVADRLDGGPIGTEVVAAAPSVSQSVRELMTDTRTPTTTAADVVLNLLGSASTSTAPAPSGPAPKPSATGRRPAPRRTSEIPTPMSPTAAVLSPPAKPTSEASAVSLTCEEKCEAQFVKSWAKSKNVKAESAAKAVRIRCLDDCKGTK
jgi:hypothetical protein